MLRQFALILTILATTFGSPASAEMFKTTKHTLLQKMFPRGELHFSCESPENLKKFLDQGFDMVLQMQSQDDTCGLIKMTAIASWGPKKYRAKDGTVYLMYRFMVNGYYYYTYYR